MAMNKSQKMENFNDDLSVSMSELRELLNHWGLRDWRHYLVVRKPGKPGSYVVMAHPSDDSGFDAKLIELHEAMAQEGN